MVVNLEELQFGKGLVPVSSSDRIAPKLVMPIDGDIIIGEYFDEEDDYSFDDEEIITTGTSRMAIEKLKAESFVDEREKLGKLLRMFGRDVWWERAACGLA
ncbi:hypothetical protein FEM48_Zijuj07G0037900 [Ziziphus jujuba var. spinosa]|uniref:Uncharacterized protein n=1 Tax=Ziziphus jujuba var. spinosa TaxID=714518 RepID=A0A978V295_ZIZJJ|nr:hypothetical protein FEM48_Zijuj07G0037900 [Ziziphus jujuba var. spinosa]